MKRFHSPMRIASLFLIACLMLLLAACSASSNFTTDTASQELYGETASSSMAATSMTNRADAELGMVAEATDSGTAPSTGGGNLSTAALEDRKLIREIYLSMETLEFDETLQSLENKLSELGGYIQNSSIDGGNTYYDDAYNRQSNRYAYLTIRVPADQADAFLSAAQSYGNILSQTENLEDVTLSYTDLETRRKSLETERDRLLELLETATDLDGIIQLEARLSEVQYEIESLVSSLKNYDNRIDYATITIDISEVRRITPAEPESFVGRIQNGFAETLQDIADGAENLLVWILINSPYLLMIAVVAAVLIVLFLWIRRRHRRQGKQDPTASSVETDRSATDSLPSDRSNDPPTQS